MDRGEEREKDRQSIICNFRYAWNKSTNKISAQALYVKIKKDSKKAEEEKQRQKIQN